MNAIIPRYDLPDTWAGKGACPVCRVRGRLAVVHQTVTPDQMWCAACDAAFEVESGGAHLRLVRLPITVPTATEAMLEQWVLPSELPALLAGPAPVAEPAPPPSAASAAALLVETAAAPLTAAPETPTPLAEMPAAPPEPTLTTFLNLPPKTTLSDSIRELLYGPDETGEPATGHTLPAEPPAPAASPAATLLAHLRAAPPAVAPDPAVTVAAATAAVAEMLEPAVLAPVEPPVLSPDSAALLAQLLQELPAPPAPADDVSFLDDLAAHAGAPLAPADQADLPPAPAPSAEPAPALSGEAAALLAQLLQELPAAQAPADADQFLDALAAGAAPPVTGADTAPVAAVTPPAETGLVTTGEQAVAVPDVVIIVPDPPNPDELAARAAQLYELGNSLALIQAALERTGASADQVALAMRAVRAQDQQRLARHAGSYRLLAGVGLVILLVLVIVGAASMLRPVAAGPTPTPGGPTLTPGGPTLTPTPAYNPIIALINLLMPGDVEIVNGNTPTPGPTSELLAQFFPDTATPPPLTATALAVVAATAAAEATTNHVEDGVPDWIKALVPEGITVVGVPTPGVEPAGPPTANCPFTAELAAALFGGRGADWRFDGDNNGWYMTVLGTPVTVRVPLNMSAGYLVVGETLEFRNVHGPATITNVNFIAISCDL